MKTRRKSKAAAAAATNVTRESTAASPNVTEEAGSSSLLLTLPDELDVECLSSLFPGVSLEAPRAEDIVALHQLVLSRDTDLEIARRDLEESQVELQKKDIELDQALQDRESSGK